MKPWEYTEEEKNERERVVNKWMDTEYSTLTEKEKIVLYDKPCKILCDALNRIPGINTMTSCCGHNKFEFHVMFMSEGNLALFEVARWFGNTNRRKYKISEWNIKLDISSMYAAPAEYFVSYTLRGPVGEEGYKDACTIAQNIHKYYDGEREKPLFFMENLPE